MCCESTVEIDVPPAALEMLARYRRDRQSTGMWGEEPFRTKLTLLARHAPFLPHDHAAELVEDRSMSVDALADWLQGPEFVRWLHEQHGAEPPDGLLVASVHGHEVVCSPWTPRPLLPGAALDAHLLVVANGRTGVRLEDGSGRDAPVRGVMLSPVRFTAAGPPVGVLVDRRRTVIEGVRPASPVVLALVAQACSRWSVVDEAGQAHFPDGALQKWDVHGRGFFHARSEALTVPDGRVTVRVSRGGEFRSVVRDLELAPGSAPRLEVEPRRWIDPSADGWYSADLHVHMNYGGAEVCTPEQAARMQLGEGLHLMNLVAGNRTTALVYDREAFESSAGRDLWSTDGALARMGVEFRNDLLGHVHATGLEAAPGRYSTGHAGSDDPEDWPPNLAALEEFRSLGAIVGYCHPVAAELREHGPPDPVFAEPRTMECRELVADAALGAVDSMDVLSNHRDASAAILFRRLLGAGIELAATAGTDSMLSLASAGTFSNPPGWARVYAAVEGRLSLASFMAAIRAGRTIVTNGPWLHLQVDGAGPGERLDVPAGATVHIEADATGPGVGRIQLHTADGLVASAEGVDERARLEVPLRIDAPTFVVASVVGEPHEDVLDERAMAHTSAVYLDVDGQRVARIWDAAWCLSWLDQLAELVDTHGVFSLDERRDEVHDVIDRARAVYRRIIDG